MRILVTGDSGLIGSHLVDRLVKEHDVFGLSRSNKNGNEEVTHFSTDLTDTKITGKLIGNIKPDIVFHLAANAAESKSMFSPIEISESNIRTFYNVLVPAIRSGMKRFVFVSSIAVYGSIHVPFREQDLPLPQDIYGISKLSIENALRVMASVHDFEYVVVRPHNVYGERQNMSDPYRNVVTLFMNEILKGKPYTMYGDGSMKRCFSYVKDVVEVIEKCGFEDVSGMTFNVGADTARSIQELSDMIQKVSGTSIVPNHLPDRVHEVHFAKSDHTLLKKVLGYNETSFEDGIRATWEWAKSQGPTDYKFTELEIDNPQVPANWKK